MKWNPKNIKIKIIGLLLGIIFLALFFYGQKPDLKSEEQKQFEYFVSAIESIDRSSIETNPSFPQIKLSLNLIQPGVSLALASKEERSDSINKKILRLIQMAKESEIFSAPNSSAPDLKITIATESLIFDRSIRYKDIQNNTAAQSMIKLFQMYAQGIMQGEQNGIK